MSVTSTVDKTGEGLIAYPSVGFVLPSSIGSRQDFVLLGRATIDVDVVSAGCRLDFLLCS
jgi:hypothetical protein